MIEGLKPYADNQESGERWIGEIPASWQLRRAKFLFREIDERSKTGKEELLSVSHKTGVTPRSQKSVTMFLAESNVGHKICRPQDLVINTLWAWMAALGVSRHTGIVSPAYGVYRLLDPEKFLPRFADLLLRTPMYAGEYQRRSTGVNSSRLRLYAEYFFRIPILLPSPDEQAAIVRFLDHANRKIDGFIRAKRKLIGLLNEQKQAIIHRAVTRGLDPNTKLKPTGIPWLGEIPAHWEMWRISRFARVGNGSTPSRGRPTYWNGGTYPWLNSSQVNRGFIDSADQFVTESALRECHLPKVPAGSVLVAITGQGKTRGLSAVLGIEATINQHIAFITPRSPVCSPDFIHLALTAAYLQLRASSDDAGSTKGAITCEDLKHFKLPVPPRPEQEAILCEVRDETSAVTTAIARTEREIALMQEYRTRLTADIVTGKLDVREAAAKLPEEAEEVIEADISEDESELEEIES
jgi:type I restriction enzyme S subunit